MSRGPCDVAFTQYLRPHGRAQAVLVARDAERARRAAVLEGRGCRLEIEELGGTASMTVERDVAGEVEVVSSRLCPNGPPVLAAVDALVDEAYGRVGEGP